MMKLLVFLTFGFSLSACQVGYIINNAYHQARLLKKAVPLEDALKNEKLNPEVKRKLILAAEAKQFAEQKLHLSETKNYSTFVQLDGPYVTYVVSAAPKDELKYYTWWFPIVGSVPYKGYFDPESAKALAKELKEENLDTYVRGVSAFSTLGWFRDPILSSMTSYDDYDLVNTIIHETVHSTLYIKSNASFNERLATFLGDLGAKLFYQQKEPDIYKATQQTVANETSDQKIFSQFISQEIKNLEEWYTLHRQDADFAKNREAQFQKIRENFSKNVKPQLKTQKYLAFEKSELNNARLMGFKLYMNDLSDFEKLSAKLNGDFAKILEYCLSLEKEKDPEAALKKFTELSQ